MSGLPPIASLGSPRLLVVGDVMLDEYVWGEVARISPEAPVPVLAGRHIEYKAGGAGSVMENLAVLGARVDVCGLVGRDDAGERLRAQLARQGIPAGGLVTSETRPTTRKSRLLGYVQHANRAQQQMLRVDWEVVGPPCAEERRRVLDYVRGSFGQRLDAVLLPDYEKGLLDEEILREILALAARHEVPVLVDPGRSLDYGRYRGATLLCPNRYESEHATGVAMTGPAGYARAGALLIERLALRYAALTLDREGIYLVQADANAPGGSRGASFPTEVRAVTDVAGAGDMVLSLLGFALAAGWSIEHAVEIANIAAGIEVTKVGVAPVELWELERAVADRSDGAHTKVMGASELARITARARAARRRIVFTNGCFDVLHAGHTLLLERARALGDMLIVALNSDASVRRLKGPGRPINDAKARARQMSAISAVDHVVFFEEDTPLGLVEGLRPDLLVKGDDYRGREVVGRELVEGYGGKVVLIPLEPDISTSKILERIRNPAP